MTRKVTVTKTALLALLMASGMVSCEDSPWGASETEKPVWLGGSIYQELSNPNPDFMEGTFKCYVRLVDDLGYAETLSRTGSKTVFPANDEAFERFFQSNTWGVKCYEDLSEAQKKMLLYSSMLDNAYLLRMLSNVSATSTSVERGKAIKHQTQLSVTDSITYLPSSSLLHDGAFANSRYWDSHRNTGLHYVSDATQPMMVHFTKEQMLNNAITTGGDNSDFAVITGAPYKDGSVYVFRNPVTHGDLTCLNGYIHQMRDVMVPQGNMAQVIRESGETSYFSRILDRFAAPFVDEATTKTYNDWAAQNGRQQIPSIYQLRYISSRSQGVAGNKNPDGVTEPSNTLLLYDPGWNQYYPNSATSISDMGAMFVPDDAAMKRYFLPGGEGAFMMEQFGKKPNTEEYLAENIDSVPKYIMATFVNNLMKASFIDAVPSKFSTIVNTAAENMGMNMNYLKKESDGTYDVKIANNGVVYILNDVIMPDEYQSVYAPTLFNDNLSVMRWAIQDKTIYNGNTSTPSYLGLDFWAYLLAMSANYALFVPTNDAFDAYFVDPCSLLPGQTPTGLHFFTTNTNPFMACRRVAYDTRTGRFGDEIPQNVDIKSVSSQFADVLNTHTVVLGSGETFGERNYYRTKQGAAIYVNGAEEGKGASAAGNAVQANIVKTWNEKNGRTFAIDKVLQTPTQSIYTTLKGNSRFDDFLSLCDGFEAAAETGILEWLGISNVPVPPATKSAQEQLLIFAKAMQKFSSGNQKQVSIDMNLTLLNSYHYTVYAPNNTAVQKAFDMGLPSWTDIQAVYESTATRGGATEANGKRQVQAMLDAIHRFICYHLQRGYVFADKRVEGGEYQTLQLADNDQFMKLHVGGSAGVLTVRDAAGVTHRIESDQSGLVNTLARDYLFSYEAETDEVPQISTSAFAVIHEISEPLYLNSNKRFDR